MRHEQRSTRDRWQQVASVYELAIERDGNARAAFLSEACAGDMTLRREVESLLQEDDSRLLLDRSVWATAAMLFDHEPAIKRGATLGPYRIDDPIGAGSMGEVFRATDVRLNRTVAIKVLPAGGAPDPRLRTRFAREARAVAALTHANICTLYDVGREGETDFLVMELLEGDTLATRLEKGKLPFELALASAIEIASALDHAHRHGVIHRDLKPANIMLTASGAKLLDFGLAKLRAGKTDDARVADVTLDGAIVGTVRYMAPEQIRGDAAESRSDLFSLGAIVYEMLTGTRAFEAEGLPAVAAAIVEHHPPAVSSLQPLASPALDHIVQRCLAKDPAERWQTASDVMGELKWVSHLLDVGRAPYATTRTQTGPVTRLLRSHWQLAVGLLAVLVLGVWIGATRSGRAQDDRRLTFVVGAPEGSRFALATMRPFPTLAPDGRRLAFVAPFETSETLWIQTLGRADARPVRGTPAAVTFPFWSPDGRFVAFGDGGRIKRVSAEVGGAPQDLTAVDGAYAGGTWSPNGVIVFAAGNGLYRLPSGGGEPISLTRIDERLGETSHRFPVILPDGERFLYLILGTQEQHQGLYIGSLQDPQLKKRVVTTDANGAFGVGPDGRDYLFFVRDFTLLAQPFDAERGELRGLPAVVAAAVEPGEGGRFAPFSVAGRSFLYRPRFRPKTRLVWLNRRGIPGETLGIPGAYYRSPSLSPDETKLAVSHLGKRGVEDIWWFDLARRVSEPLTTERVAARYPVWSPDSRRVVFLASRATSSWGLYSRAINLRSEERRLIARQGPLMRLRDMTRDERVVVFEQGNDLWVLPLDGNLPPRPLLTTPFTETHGRVSPDGRWLAFASNETGSLQVYVTSFLTPTARTRISTAGGSDPQWRADGRELYYVSSDQTLMAVPVGQGATWEHGDPEPLFRTSFEPFSLTFGSVYTPSRDGQRFLVVELLEPDEPQLVVTLNWGTD
jgi:serine/threonine protein kinase/Tol biopolymer transport system component